MGKTATMGMTESTAQMARMVRMGQTAQMETMEEMETTVLMEMTEVMAKTEEMVKMAQAIPQLRCTHLRPHIPRQPCQRRQHCLGPGSCSATRWLNSILQVFSPCGRRAFRLLLVKR
jgi:hypothetical protein